MSKREVTEVSTQDANNVETRCPCPHCGVETTHVVLSIVNSRRFEDKYSQFIENHLIVQCAGCGTISFSCVSANTDEEEYGDKGQPYLVRHKTHYPEHMESDVYVDQKRIMQVSSLKSKTYDSSRLAQILWELNLAYKNKCYISCLILIRAIMDHVPPVFGVNNFTQLANNYNVGGRSFKQSMLRLETTCRKLADGCLHNPIRKTESIPTSKQVEFRADIDALLGELVRVFPK